MIQANAVLRNGGGISILHFYLLEIPIMKGEEAAIYVSAKFFERRAKRQTEIQSPKLVIDD